MSIPSAHYSLNRSIRNRSTSKTFLITERCSLAMQTRSQDTQSRPQYDIPTAVTFLLAGLGIGSLFGILYSATLDHPNSDASKRSQQTLQ
jgi:hypothetical protein